jgi:hypothetical protein
VGAAHDNLSSLDAFIRFGCSSSLLIREVTVTAKEFLEQQARAHKLVIRDSFHADFDLRPEAVMLGADLIQFCALMNEAGYVCNFKKDNTINVHAPHHKRHDWDESRGWNCTHGLTVDGCEVFKVKDKYKGWTKEQLLKERQDAYSMRDACLGQLYKSVLQDKIDEIDTVLGSGC